MIFRRELNGNFFYNINCYSYFVLFVIIILVLIVVIPFLIGNLILFIEFKVNGFIDSENDTFLRKWLCGVGFLIGIGLIYILGILIIQNAMNLVSYVIGVLK